MNPTSELNELASQALDQASLSPAQVIRATEILVDEDVPPESKANFLTYWNKRGEQTEEISALASFFRKHARNPGLEDYAGESIDIVGTGGDKSGTFNISTTTAILVAASGVKVIKHGNRSITSMTGSADLLSSIGVPLDASDEVLKASVAERGFCFLFAPHFHPIFKAIMPVRKGLAEKGQKTVFNILGPLINPAQPAFQLMGVFASNWVDALAKTLSSLGTRSGAVVHGRIGDQNLDELTVPGNHTLSPVGDFEAIEEIETFLAENGHGNLDALKGGDSDDNCRIYDQVLSGTANPILLDTICLNTALALRIVGKCKSIDEGFSASHDLLASGTARKWVEETKSFYQDVL